MKRLALIENGIVKQVIVIMEDTAVISDQANVADVYDYETGIFAPPVENVTQPETTPQESNDDDNEVRSS